MSPLAGSPSPRMKRVLWIVLVGVLFVVQLVDEGRSLRAHPSLTETPFIWFASYALIALLFLGIGSLVWLYGYSRQRTVATLLFTFCSLMTFAFGTLSSSAQDSVLNAIGSVSSALAVLVLLFVLVLFPVNLLNSRRVHPKAFWTLLTVLFMISGLCLLAITRCISVYLFRSPVPSWWTFLGLIYYGIAGISAICISIISARAASSVRARQQTRLFFVGTLLSFIPILLLTVVPTLLFLQTNYNGSQSMVFLVLFPLTLGYSVLRYDVLIFDFYIRRVCTWIVGGIGLILLSYFLFAIDSTFVMRTNQLPLIAGLVALGTIGAPCIWWLASMLTERFFFPETAHYRQLLAQTSHRSQETLSLEVAAHMLALDLLMTIKTFAGVFVLNEQGTAYDLIPPLQDDGRAAVAHARLIQRLGDLISTDPAASHSWVNSTSPIVGQLAVAPRPLFLSEARHGIQRYLAPHLSEWDPLIAPLMSASKRLIGFVILDERGDRQPLAGSELEIIQQIASRMTTPLETARSYVIATQQQEQSNIKLAEALEQQKLLNEQKDQFIVNVSHELRTPLAEVVGYLELLQEYADTLTPDMLHMFVAKAAHGCDELLGLVNAVLDAGYLANQEQQTHTQSVSLPTLLREEISHLDPRSTSEHIIEMDILEPLWVQADQRSLRQVFRNLLSNALKYSPSGTTIGICAEYTKAENLRPDSDTMVQVTVADQGGGIPQDELPLLFGKFVRLQRDLTSSIRGTGLGLFITRQLIEGMGGRIWAESTGIPGEGTRFHFTLLMGVPPEEILDQIRDKNLILSNEKEIVF